MFKTGDIVTYSKPSNESVFSAPLFKVFSSDADKTNVLVPLDMAKEWRVEQGIVWQDTRLLVIDTADLKLLAHFVL